jgi:hypothetical protein
LGFGSLALVFLSKLERQNPKAENQRLILHPSSVYLVIRLSIEVISETLRTILTKVGFSNERAAICARLFAETSRDGVYSHGLNRLIT